MKRIFILMLAMSFVFGQVLAQEWNKALPASGSNSADIGTLVTNNNVALDRALANYVQGCAISYVSTTSISVAAGSVVCSLSDGSIRYFRKNITATTVNCAALSASTTYYVYAIADAVSDNFTVEASTSSTTPSGTHFKRLGSFAMDGSTHVIASSITNDYIASFGVWTAKSATVIYQATTDGFVTVRAYGSTGFCIMQGYTDVNATPITIIQQNKAQSSDWGSIMFPVKKGDYWEVVFSGTLTTAEIWWLPLGN